MTLRLPDLWVWDFWIADAGTAYHCFYLQAPRSLGNPDLRHEHATVGHAVSVDLIEWEVMQDALLPGPRGAWDDRATWTGSIVQSSGVWHMLYTGTSSAEGGAIQRIGLATSLDLGVWTRHPDNPLIEADARWYERLDAAGWPHEAWRDPWVFPDAGGRGWHALITARSRSGPRSRRGVIGHARSIDLCKWTVEPPLASPGRFPHLEVPQVFRVWDRWHLLFSVDLRRGGRTYACRTDSPLGPFDIARAEPLGSPWHYSGRLVNGRDGRPALLAFLNHRDDGTFIGELSDPMQIDVDARGNLVATGRTRNDDRDPPASSIAFGIGS